jgi:hypothetical protein
LKDGGDDDDDYDDDDDDDDYAKIDYHFFPAHTQLSS